MPNTINMNNDYCLTIRKLEDLRQQNLPDHYKDIGVRDDDPAVAGWDNCKLLLLGMKIYELLC